MKKLVSLAVSVSILAVIYWRIDFRALARVFDGSSAFWLSVSLLMVVPLTLVTAFRLVELMPQKKRFGFGEATRVTLAASSLNMVLPSKLGDIAKAHFMKKSTNLDGSLAFAVVVFEKSCDMLSLLFWCSFGLLLYPRKDALFWSMTAVVASGLVVGILLLGVRPFAQLVFRGARRVLPARFDGTVAHLATTWDEMYEYFWSDKGRAIEVAFVSVALWLLHLVQIWLFIFALHARTPFIANLALAPLAILAGLAPLTLAGIGTRDVGLIYFYAPYLSPPVGAALGILCTLRYFLPALGGVPFLGGYFADRRGGRDVAS